jgi:hypothetical protein
VNGILVTPQSTASAKLLSRLTMNYLLTHFS